MVQKLKRESLSLPQVQDIAGVRVDADFTPTPTAVTAQFTYGCGCQPAASKSSSGRFAQSAWANTYERLGDRFGRGIRYREMPEGGAARRLVERLRNTSEGIASAEMLEVEVLDLQTWLEGIPSDDRDDKHDELEVMLGVTAGNRGPLVRTTRGQWITQAAHFSRGWAEQNRLLSVQLNFFTGSAKHLIDVFHSSPFVLIRLEGDSEDPRNMASN